MTESQALAALKGKDPERIAEAEAELWRMWHQSGNAQIDAQLAEGIAAIERRDLTEAEAIFTRLIESAPWFAEGWNKRATVRYIAENYVGSIADCREVLARTPHHFGALSGQGLCHMALAEHSEAARLFRRTLEVHPSLQSARANLQAAITEVIRWN
jgi:tetratricopeptide (TPR) repeat protein